MAWLHHALKFDISVPAASLGYLMNRQRDAVGLTAFDEDIVTMCRRASRPGTTALLVTLDRLGTAHDQRAEAAAPARQHAD